MLSSFQCVNETLFVLTLLCKVVQKAIVASDAGFAIAARIHHSIGVYHSWTNTETDEWYAHNFKNCHDGWATLMLRYYLSLKDPAQYYKAL